MTGHFRSYLAAGAAFAIILLPGGGERAICAPPGSHVGPAGCILPEPPAQTQGTAPRSVHAWHFEPTQNVWISEWKNHLEPGDRAE